MNQNILDDIVKQDYAAISQRIETFLSDAVKDSHADGVVFGLSGGIDSAVIAHICSRTIKKDTLAMILPDTDITPETETEDALRVINHTGLDYKLLDIKPIVYEYSKYVEPDQKAKGNLRARVRANIIYYYANAKNYRVLGSSDKSEYLLGYFTKFGDGAADVTPIISLYKTQIRKIAEFLRVPQNIISKKSSPHLWDEHTAEGEIGATYEEVDSILYCTFEKKMSIVETADATQIDSVLVKKILQAVQKNAHKRTIPQGPGDGT